MKPLRQALPFIILVGLLLVGNDSLVGQSEYENPWGGGMPAETGNLAFERHPVEGFAWPTSVLPGDTIRFYVSVMYVEPQGSGSQDYETKIFRSPDFGAGQEVFSFSDTTGHFYPLRDANDSLIYPGDYSRSPVDYKIGCKNFWAPTARTLVVPSHWTSGLYFARLNHLTLNDATKYYYIPFVVRATSPGATSKVLFKFDLSTHQAYNYWGGGSLYSTGQDPATLTPDSIIAFDRPINGDISHYAASYYVPFEKTLRDSGYSMEYCNNIDIDSTSSNPFEFIGLNLLKQYRTLVIINHDEYWSTKERYHIEAFKGSPPLGSGLPSGLHGNIARFAANTCYWRITWIGDTSNDKYLKLQCLKDNFPDTSLHDRDKWRKTSDGPEAKFLGSQYETGWNYVGFDPATEQPSDRVHSASHWIFKNTGLAVGDTFGFGIVQDGRQRGIVSNEVDNTVDNGNTYTFEFPLDTLAQRNVYSNIGGVHDSILHQMVYYEDRESNARIFGQGAMGWQYGLAGTINADDVIRMKTITINIISHFSGKKYIGKVWTSNPLTALEWTANIELDGNVEIPEGKYLKAISNTITVDSTFAIDGTLEINGNVSIAGPGQVIVGATGVIKVMDGATLTIAPTGQMYSNANAQFIMGSGSSITVNGTFHAEGTANNEVRFTSAQGASAWNGINAYNPNLVTLASLLLDHVEISGASRAVHVKTSMPATISHSIISGTTEMAIEIVPNLVNSGNSNEDVLINNVTIAPENGDGIVVVNTSLARIRDCTLYGQAQESTAGLRFDNASPTITGTTVENFHYGTLAVTNSSPVFQDAQFGGYDLITHNSIGLQCDNSNVVLGILDEQTEWEGGMNSIYDNAVYDIVLEGSGVYAQNNWWGDSQGPDLDHFSIDGESELHYKPWLEEDPNSGLIPLRGGAIAEGLNNLKPILEGTLGPGELTRGSETSQIQEAIVSRVRGRHREAIARLREIVESASESLYVKKWAVSELLSNAGRDRTSGNANYLRNLQNEQLLTSIRATFPQTLVEEQNATQASTEWSNNITSSNDDLKRAGLYGKFLLALYNDDNIQDAATFHDRLRAEYRNASQTLLAERQLSLARALLSSLSVVSGGIGKNAIANPNSSIISKPIEFALRQNYPNPFNPATTIRFQIGEVRGRKSEVTHVTLKVFDLLGREVATLVNEVMQPGSFERVFNAEGLSSGVYLYQLRAGSFAQTKKLLLLR